MRILRFFGSRWGIGLLAVGVLAAVGGWLGRDTILGWYYLERLIRASEQDRASWAECVARRDSAALPGLVGRFTEQDANGCVNSQAGVAAIVAHWPGDDPRRARLAVQLAEGFSRDSLPGQRRVLELFAEWLQVSPLTSEVRDCAVRLVPVAGRSTDKDVRAAGLALCGSLVKEERRPDVLACCRELIRKSFQDTEDDNRALAARLAALTPINLLPEVAPLLDDRSPAVRQVAMLVVGPAPEAISTDDLLRSLHDTDEDVRRLCEAQLRDWRGLRHEDIALGRLISDPKPDVRLQVLENLCRARDLEPGVWLRRLSHDPSPAVRAAAIRSAGELLQIDLSDRIRQMAQNDPSPTVRQLAQFYLMRQSPNSER
jgi:hypothetical protein